MREAFGGTFIIKLLMVFIVIYISFMAVAINYAKSFRVKNNVINILEQQKYDGGGITSTSIVGQALDSYFSEVGYDKTMSDLDEVKNNCKGTLYNGVCVTDTSGGGNPKYYKVTTYIAVKWPLFSINLVVPISGETKSIYS